MRVTDLLRSSTFRLVLSYMALFGASVLLLLGFIYWSTIAVIAHQTDESIKTEISWLTGLYTDHGLSSLISTINERSAHSKRSSSYYAVSSADKRLLAGNIPVRFDLAPEQLGWKNIEMNEARTTGRVVQIRARSVQLNDGEYLLVGRDRRQLIVSQNLIIPALLWGLIIMIVLAILGGLVMGRSVLRHIEQINLTVREIMAGDLSRRIPGNNSSDEFDQLANNLNGMLDEIERLMAGIRQVSNNVAHDLRTPLTRLRNQLEELRTGFADDSPNYEYVEKSIEYADQLLSTFNALLRIARIEAGGQKTNMKLIDVTLLLNDAKELYEAVAESKNILIRSEVAGLPTFLADRDLLFQAVTNLLDNAIKYTPEGGKVSLSASQSKLIAEISVSDTGPGIPEESREKVIQRFYRLEDSRTSEGNGLGLSLVEAVAHMHKGQLVLTDNNPGLKATLQFPAFKLKV